MGKKFCYLFDKSKSTVHCQDVVDICTSCGGGPQQQKGSKDTRSKVDIIANVVRTSATLPRTSWGYLEDKDNHIRIRADERFGVNVWATLNFSQ